MATLSVAVLASPATYAGGGGGGGSSAAAPTAAATSVAGPTASVISVVATPVVQASVAAAMRKGKGQATDASGGGDACVDRSCFRIRMLIRQQTKALQQLLTVSYMVSQMGEAVDTGETALSAAVLTELVMLSEQASE